jgi:LysM repeat protein
VDRICPLLALDLDRRAVVDGVDAAHRCHATLPSVPVERHLQSGLCLTTGHARCERYQQHVGRTGVIPPGRAPVGDGLVATRLVLAPEPSWRGIAGRARQARSGRLVAAGVVVLVILGGALTAAVAGSGGLDLGRLLGPGVTASPTASPTPSAAPATPSVSTPSSESPPTVTVAPSPTPAPTPVPTPPPTPQATPPPPQTYVVQAGDTLALIAQRFGATVDAIQAANGIEDPNEIVIGQVLIIP